jgi:hypothetical protein
MREADQLKRGSRTWLRRISPLILGYTMLSPLNHPSALLNQQTVPFFLPKMT